MDLPPIPNYSPLLQIQRPLVCYDAPRAAQLVTLLLTIANAAALILTALGIAGPYPTWLFILWLTYTSITFLVCIVVAPMVYFRYPIYLRFLALYLSIVDFILYTGVAVTSIVYQAVIGPLEEYKVCIDLTTKPVVPVRITLRLGGKEIPNPPRDKCLHLWQEQVDATSIMIAVLAAYFALHLWFTVVFSVYAKELYRMQKKALRQLNRD